MAISINQVGFMRQQNSHIELISRLDLQTKYLIYLLQKIITYMQSYTRKNEGFFTNAMFYSRIESVKVLHFTTNEESAVLYILVYAATHLTIYRIFTGVLDYCFENNNRLSTEMQLACWNHFLLFLC